MRIQDYWDLIAEIRIKDYWDLAAIIAFSLILDMFIVFFPDSLFRSVLGLAFVSFFPGYAFMVSFFPEKEELNNLERLALSLGLSVAIVPLIVLGLNSTPLGIRLVPILVTLTVFNLAFASFGIYRRTRATNPWIPWISMEKLKEELGWNHSGRLDKALTIILLLAIVFTMVTMVFVVSNPGPRETFTEFYILGSSGDVSNYPTDLVVGEEGNVTIGIVNHEYREVTYYLEIWLVNLTYDMNTNDTYINNTYIHDMYFMDEFSVTLPHVPVAVEGNWTSQWEMNYTFTINTPGKWQLWFLLFKDNKPSLPDSINGDYAQTTATKRILDALEGKILALKLNIEVRTAEGLQ